MKIQLAETDGIVPKTIIEKLQKTLPELYIDLNGAPLYPNHSPKSPIKCQLTIRKTSQPNNIVKIEVYTTLQNIREAKKSLSIGLNFPGLPRPVLLVPHLGNKGPDYQVSIKAISSN
ncbi:MAG: hypothetical protein Q7T34_01795 [Candidatus Parcubacteria bacterium]|nr:hypothetical protein [Candidatus Parcubacteria bacterium]